MQMLFFHALKAVIRLS